MEFIAAFASAPRMGPFLSVFLLTLQTTTTASSSPSANRARKSSPYARRVVAWIGSQRLTVPLVGTPGGMAAHKRNRAQTGVGLRPSLSG